jgi:hypothetical protein
MRDKRKEGVERVAGELNLTLTELNSVKNELNVVSEERNAATRELNVVIKRLARLRLRPTRRVEYRYHSGGLGSLIDAFQTTVKRQLGLPSCF